MVWILIAVLTVLKLCCSIGNVQIDTVMVVVDHSDCSFSGCVDVFWGCVVFQIMGGEGKNGGSSDKSGGHPGQQTVEERKVIITGSPEAQWKVNREHRFS